MPRSQPQREHRQPVLLVGQLALQPALFAFLVVRPAQHSQLQVARCERRASGAALEAGRAFEIEPERIALRQTHRRRLRRGGISERSGRQRFLARGLGAERARDRQHGQRLRRQPVADAKSIHLLEGERGESAAGPSHQFRGMLSLEPSRLRVAKRNDGFGLPVEWRGG